jgi:1-acyl-sn-glycerol-3-phosphate acyltransferase
MTPKFFQQITYWPIYLILKILFRYKIEGQENLKGLENQPVIFASNHASLIDGPISAAAMPREGLTPKSFFPVRFLVAKEFFSWRTTPFLFPLSSLTAFYVRANGSIPVDRGAPGDLSYKLKEAIEVLKKGAKLWIYPEGKITKDGNLQPGKRGVAYLHQATSAAIVPVALIGTFKILSFKKILNRARVKVIIGKPIYSLGNVSLEEGTEKIMKEIENLLK